MHVENLFSQRLQILKIDNEEVQQILNLTIFGTAKTLELTNLSLLQVMCVSICLCQANHTIQYDLLSYAFLCAFVTKTTISLFLLSDFHVFFSHKLQITQFNLFLLSDAFPCVFITKNKISLFILSDSFSYAFVT